MAVHGTIPEFTGKDWLSYQERIGFYFEANDIACDSVTKTTKRRAILLSVIGSDTYTLLRSLANYWLTIFSPSPIPFYKDTIFILHSGGKDRV